MWDSESRPSIEWAAKRWRRSRLALRVVRQVLAAALVLWLAPEHPAVWWSLAVLVPLAGLSLSPIVRLKRVTSKAREVDEGLRRLDEV